LPGKYKCTGPTGAREPRQRLAVPENEVNWKDPTKHAARSAPCRDSEKEVAFPVGRPYGRHTVAIWPDRLLQKL